MSPVPAGSPSHGGDVTAYVWQKPPELVHSFLFCFFCLFLYMPLSTVFYSINSLDKSPFSYSVLSGLISALLVLSTIFLYLSLFMKFSFSPDIIPSGWLGSKHLLIKWLLWAQSARKDYIRAENKLQSTSMLLIPQAIIIILHCTSLFFSNHVSNSIHNFWKNKTHALEPIYISAGTQHRNLHPAVWPILFCGPTQEPVLAISNTGKTWEKFWKKCRWMDRNGRNEQGGNPRR